MILEKAPLFNYYDLYMSGAPSIAGSAGTALPAGAGVPKEAAQPQGPPPKEVALTMKRSEIASTQTIRTPEAESRDVELSKSTVDTLVETISFNLPIIDQMPHANDFFKNFLKEFKAKNPKLDLKNKQQVAEAARQFIATGGGDALLAANKFLEWEGSLEQGISGGFFRQERAPKSGTNADEDKYYYLRKRCYW